MAFSSKSLDGRLPDHLKDAVAKIVSRSVFSRHQAMALMLNKTNEEDRDFKPKFERLPPYGPMNAKLAIINTFPYPYDIEVGVPFSDSFGRITLALLHSMGINREDIYMSTALKDLRFTELEGNAFEEMMYEEVVHHIFAEISMIEADHILIMGERFAQIMKEVMNLPHDLPMSEMRKTTDVFDLAGRPITLHYTYDAVHLVAPDMTQYATVKDILWTDLTKAATAAGIIPVQNV